VVAGLPGVLALGDLEADAVEAVEGVVLVSVALRADHVLGAVELERVARARVESDRALGQLRRGGVDGHGLEQPVGRGRSRWYRERQAEGANDGEPSHGAGVRIAVQTYARRTRSASRVRVAPMRIAAALL